MQKHTSRDTTRAVYNEWAPQAICTMKSFYYHYHYQNPFKILFSCAYLGFCYLNLTEINKFKHQRKNGINSALSSKKTSSCKWSIRDQQIRRRERRCVRDLTERFLAYSRKRETPESFILPEKLALLSILKEVKPSPDRNMIKR